MNKKALYEHIMQNVAKEVKMALNEAECNEILEQYGLTYIFVLNEGESSNIFQKFKQPLSSILSKVKSKFGDKSCRILADIVKKAQQKGKKTLLNTLTLITLLSCASPALGNVTSNFSDGLQNDVVVSMKAIANAQDAKGQELKNIIDQESKDFANILYTLKNDKNALYGGSGVGCSDISLKDAEQKAIEDATNTLKQQYGEDAIKEYDIQFKAISNKSFRKTSVIGNQYNSSACYTVVVVAYQNVK